MHKIFILRFTIHNKAPILSTIYGSIIYGVGESNMIHWHVFI